jgi:hypothetical protein
MFCPEGGNVGVKRWPKQRIHMWVNVKTIKEKNTSQKKNNSEHFFYKYKSQFN